MIKIHGFKFGHLTRWQFWWIFYAAIANRIHGKEMSIGSMELNQFFTVGRGKLFDALWEAGFTCQVCAKVFGRKVILHKLLDVQIEGFNPN